MMATKCNSKMLSKWDKFQQRLIQPWINEFKRFYCILLGADQTVHVSTFGNFRFRCRERVEFGRTLRYGGELLSLAAFLFLLRKDDIVWDVGASVGLFTVHAAERVNRVIAYEPDPQTAARLRENVKLNNFQHKVVVMEMALGDKEHQEYLQTDGLGGFAPALGNLERHSAATPVEVKTIDGLIREGVQAPSVMKIDIEGAELLALQGARHLLRSDQRPRIVFVEVHPAFLPNFGGSSEELFSLMRESRYTILSTEDRAEEQHFISLRI